MKREAEDLKKKHKEIGADTQSKDVKSEKNPKDKEKGQEEVNQED